MKILKKYDYKFEDVLIDYTQYCEILKLIGKQVFIRKIPYIVQNDGKKEKVLLNISDEFEISDYEIKDFTGHTKKIFKDIILCTH